MANPWDNDPIISPAGDGAAAMPWANDPIVKPAAGAQPSTWDRVKSTAADVAQSAVSGVNKGVIGLAGLPGDAASFIGGVADAAAEKITGQPVPKIGTGRALGEIIGGQNIRKQYEAATGPLYEPQTTAGKFASTVGEFLPASGGGVANAIKFAAIPGVASEAAGQLTEGTGFEGPARAVAAVGAGLGAAAVGGMKAPTALSGSMQGVDDAALSQARDLLNAASQQGIRLTWDEAIGKVTSGASNMGNLRRVVENTPEGAAVLKPMMAERPAQVAAAAGRTFDNIAPPSAAPSGIGPAAGRIAEDRVNEVRGAINTATDPLYKAAETVRLSAGDMARVRALPGFDDAAKAVRSDPQLARYVQGLPDDSVGFLNEVKKQLDTAATNAASPVNAQQNMQRSAGFGADAGAVRQAAEAASPEYVQALAVQASARQQILQPILDGPIGKIASRDTTTKQAIDALFPSNPLPGSEAEIAGAMKALSNKSPMVARQLVRAHAESIFNEATQNLASGANQFGGAKFAAQIRGNPQQAANLEAAVSALPQGAERLAGLNVFLDTLEATGYRPQAGSMTAFNQQIQQQLQGGGKLGEAANAIATGGFKLPGRVTKWYEELRQGKNAGRLAEILVDPNALPLLRSIAKEPPGSSKALAITARLTAMGAQTRNQ
ncbi:MAG TPA: hypothetical protein VIU82_24960 [Bosea sp. (in: a-proteobacteria)]